MLPKVNRREVKGIREVEDRVNRWGKPCLHPMRSSVA